MTDNFNYDVTRLVRDLGKFDKDLVKALRKDIRQAAKPVAEQVKSSLPSDSPLKGMLNKGRLGWNVGPASKSTKLVFRSGSRRNSKGYSSLISVNVPSPVTVMIDMAGKKGGKTASGRAMIRALGGRPSRYAWPAAEESAPRVQLEIQHIIERYIRKVTGRH
jgi:hypothetical protein